MVHPLPLKLKEFVNDALLEWKEREDRVCKKLNMSREAFLDTLEKLREDFLKGGTNWQMAVIEIYPAITGVVRNLDWVNLFSWILSLTDRKNKNEHIARGRMVTAMFYVELLVRHDGSAASTKALKSIKARWQIVNSI